MIGLAILLAFNLLGAAAASAGVPLPGPVIGLLLLTAALALKLVKLEWVEDAADELLRHMLLFFSPVIVGILPLMPLIEREAGPMVVTLAGSTLAVMLTAGAVAAMLLRRGERAPRQPAAPAEATHGQ